MAVSGAELQFLIRMRDEASRIINQVAGAMGGMSNQARGGQQQVRGLTGSFTELNQALELAKKTYDGFKRTFGESLATFSDYDKGMAVVRRVTNMSKEEIADFSMKFDELLTRLRAVPQPRLLEIAQQAAQLGITGTDNILEFTETVGKLETSLKDLGDQAPKLIVRVLNATGEGIPAIEKFGNVLVRMGKDASASEEVILSMTAMLAQSTAQFKIGSEALLGLSTAAANLNFQPQLFGTAVQRSLQQLYDAALNNTAGMRALSDMTGITADQFRDLIKTNPADALILFLDAMKSVDASGRSTLGFLRMFNLQAAENIRVLGSASQQVDEFRQYLATARLEGQKQMALTQEFNVTMEAYFASVQAASNAWELFKKNFGKALAPVATIALQALTSVLNGLSDALTSMPEWMQTAIASAVVLIATLKTLAFAIGMVSTAARGLAVLTVLRTAVAGLVSFGAAALRVVGVVTMLARLGSIIAVVAGAVGAVIAAIGAIPIAIGVAIGAAIAAVIVFWDDIVAFFSQSWEEIGSQIIDALVNAFTSAIAKAKQLWNEFWDWFWGSSDSAAAAGGGSGSAVSVGVTPAPTDADAEVLSKLSDENRKALEQLDQYSKTLATIQEQQIAIDQLMTLPKNDTFFKNLGIEAAQIDAYIARLQTLVSLERIRADAVLDRIKSLQEETAQAAAFTATERQIVEIEEAIRQAREKKGVLTEEETRQLREQVQLLQRVRIGVAFRAEATTLMDQIEAARAITQEQKNQVEIKQKLLEFEREHGLLSAELSSILAGQLSTLQQIGQFVSLVDRLDAFGTANRRFLDDMNTLNRALREGTVSLEYYNFLVGELRRQTLDERDPWGAQVKSMREQIQLLQITGDYYEADRQAQEEINQLRDRGVLITKDHEAAMRDFHRAVQDVNREQESGFAGWARSIGTMKDNILDLQKSLASSLSDTIVNWITGTEHAWTDFIKNIGKQTLTLFTNQVLKDIFAGIGNNPGGLFSFLGIGQGLGNATAAADQLAGLSATGTMNVTAGMVNITGGLPGGLNIGVGTDALSQIGATFAPSGAGSLTGFDLGGYATSIGAADAARAAAPPGTFPASGTPPPAAGFNPLGLLASGLSFLLARIFHGGGEVGDPSVPSALVPASLFANAPRLHSGTQGDEFAALLQRSERVLTANDNRRVAGVLNNVAAMDPSDARGRRRSESGGTVVNMYVSGVQDAGSFQRSQAQILTKTQAAMSRAAARNR